MNVQPWKETIWLLYFFTITESNLNGLFTKFIRIIELNIHTENILSFDYLRSFDDPKTGLLILGLSMHLVYRNNTLFGTFLYCVSHPSHTLHIPSSLSAVECCQVPRDDG